MSNWHVPIKISYRPECENVFNFIPVLNVNVMNDNDTSYIDNLMNRIPLSYV